MTPDRPYDWERKQKQAYVLNLMDQLLWHRGCPSPRHFEYFKAFCIAHFTESRQTFN